MAQLAKRRRLGQTRATGLASLHPQAQDTRSKEAKSKPPVDNIGAPPLSSSEEDAAVPRHDEDGSKPRSKPVWKRPPKPIPESVTNDSPFRQMTSQPRPKATYGRAGANRAGRTGTAHHPKPILENKASNTDSKKSKDGSISRKTFKAPAEISIAKKKAEFRLPAAVGTVPTKATFRVPAVVKPSPPKAPQFRMPSGSMQDVERFLIASSPQNSEAAGNESTPGTQVPSSLPEDIISSNTAASFAASLADADRELSPDTFAACPVCRAPLSEVHLDAFQSTLAGLSAKARYHRQAAFCRAHREEDARRIWVERGYPKIDWAALPSRFEPHRTTILDMLEKRRDSYFRTELQAKLDARRAAGLHTGRDTLAQEFEREDDGGESVGYYGGRGAQVMMNWLAKSLAEPLRAARDTDRLLQSCGSVSAFVQRVLLPELATLLVVEDMRLAKGKGPKARRLKPPVTTIEVEEAWQRLKDSAELGRLLCLEEDDEIIAEDDEVEDYSANDDLEGVEEEEEDEDDE